MLDLDAHVFLTKKTPIRDRVNDEVLTMRFGVSGPGSSELVVFLPHGDEAALAVLDRLLAVNDNLYSAVLLRQKARAAANLDGAGASVEAYRG